MTTPVAAKPRWRSAILLCGLAAAMACSSASYDGDAAIRRACDAPAPDADRLPLELARQIRALPPSPLDSLRRVLLAVAPGCTEAVGRQLTDLGADIEYRHDSIGYLRIRIPDAQVGRVAELRTIDALLLAPTFRQFLNPQGHSFVALSSASSTRSPAARVPFPTELPADNPYTSAVGIGAEAFRARYPTYDGRGVGIGFTEGRGVDPLMPQLQQALALDGTPIPKLADVVVVSDPRMPDTGTGWVLMHDSLVAEQTTASYQGVEYTLPAPGRYRIGQFDERSSWMTTGMNDLNLDGNPPGSSGIFTMIWSSDSGTVWIDTNQDGSFADEQPMMDYSRRPDVGRFRPPHRLPGHDAVMGFTLEISEAHHAINVVIGGSHTAMSTSSAAGSRFFGGPAGGVAPGAAVVSFVGSQNLAEPPVLETAIYPWVEELIRAAEHPRVDVMMVYLGMPSFILHDGRSLLHLLQRRVTEIYGKPMAVAALNSGPRMGSSYTSPGEEILTAGAYSARATWAVNYGVDIEGEGEVRTFSGRGPADDGGPGARVVASMGYLVGDLSYRSGPQQNRRYPAGYAVGGGTSQATPTIAGAMALLLSAAKQERVTYDPHRLAVALITSARPVAGYQAHEQGAGLIDVGRAWEVLKGLTSPPVRLVAEAPVRTPWSDSLPVPGVGRGLYELGGWRPGERATRTITLRRLTGPRRAREYTLAWSSADAVFASADRVTLPLNRPVTVDVTVHPQAMGVHSAFLNVIDPATGAIVHQVLHTIVVAAPLADSNADRLQYRGTIGIARAASFFVDVPEGIPSLRVTLRSSGRSVLGLASAALLPMRVGTTGKPGSCREHPPERAQPNAATITCTLDRPRAGVWEVYVESPASGFGDPKGIEYDLLVEAGSATP